MQHILAIDYGLKRTGLAFAEKPLYIAHPLETIPSNNLSSYLEKYIVDYGVDTIVIGLPKKLNNTQTDATSHVNTFKNKLSKIINNFSWNTNIFIFSIFNNNF